MTYCNYVIVQLLHTHRQCRGVLNYTSTGVTRLDSAPGKKQVGALVFEPEVFRKQMHFIEILVTLLGLFSARGTVPLAPRRYAPDY